MWECMNAGKKEGRKDARKEGRNERTNEGLAIPTHVQPAFWTCLFCFCVFSLAHSVRFALFSILDFILGEDALFI